MGKSRETKKKILISMVSLVFCFSLLLGGTFAWFTGAINTRINDIQSGNLAMEVSYKPFGSSYTEWTKINQTTKIFSEQTVYEPGYTEAIWLRVENTGTLGFQYEMNLDIRDEIEGINIDEESFKLSDYLKVLTGLHTTDYAIVEKECNDSEELLKDFAWKEDGLYGDKVTVVKNLDVYPQSDLENDKNFTYYICFVLHMPDLGNNAANHNGEDIPQLKLGINAKAMQFPYEGDGYSEDYDADAE